jgi:hypothetical protein
MVREYVLTGCQRIAVERAIQEDEISVLLRYLIPAELCDVLPNSLHAALEMFSELFTSERHTFYT